MPLGSPNAFSVASLCWASYGYFAPYSTFGAPMGILQADLENAEMIFVWGTNPATDSPLTDMLRLQKAKKRGAQIITIDPLRTAAAQISDQWIPVQPGTDGALIHGILYQCFKNDAVDREFGEKFCQGFAELEEYVQQFPPEVVETITRVPKEKFFELASIFSSSKRIAFLSYTGLEYSDTGVQSIRALLTLWALTGHLDVEGGQRFRFPRLNPLRKPDVSFPTDVPPIGMDKYPFYCEGTKSGQFMEFPRSVLEEDPYKIRFLLVCGASILTSFPNATLFTKTLNGLDYLVSVDRFLTADALYADIVLPAATYFETTSYCGYPPLTPRPGAIQYRKKIIEPIGEAMGDYLIYATLAERLGYGHLYPQGEEEMVHYVTEGLPYSFEEFKKRSNDEALPIDDKIPAPTEDKKWALGKLRRDGKPGFPTPSGKWEITSTVLEEYGYDAFPAYTEPKEGPQNKALVKDYPLTFTSGARIQSTFRSQHLNIPGLLQMQPEAEVLIHPDDAQSRGIVTGDKVKVKTVRGNVKFTARVTSNIMPGVVEVNSGGGSPIQAEGWKDSNVNFLTDENNRDPISGFPVFKALLCEVEKV